MHFYNFHIKDYRAKTAHLTPLEHYIYRTLIDWYYLNEKPFESVEQIARYLLLPLTDENRVAINAVLDEFFNYHKGKYHHSRINEEVKDYRHKNGNDKVTSGNATDNATVTDGNAKSNAKNNKKPLSSKERQDRCKKRKRMLNALLDKGITLDKNASFDDVCNAYNANFGNANNANNNATDNATVTQNNGKNGARTINQEPITINQEKQKHADSVLEIFDFWVNAFGKDKSTKLSDVRKRKIKQRLDDGYTVEQIKQAIVNCSNSEFHLTNNHTDLELICRSVEKLDYFLGLVQKPQPSQPNNYEPNYYEKPTDWQNKVFLNGQYFDPLAGMTKEQSLAYVKANRMAGETTNEAYLRLLGGR